MSPFVVILGWCHVDIFLVEFTWNDPQVKGKKEGGTNLLKKRVGGGGGENDDIKEYEYEMNCSPFYNNNRLLARV